MIVAGTLELGVGFYIATAMSPFFTSAAIESGFSLPENAIQITSISDGFLWPNWLFVNAVQLLGGPVGLIVLAALFGSGPLPLLEEYQEMGRDRWSPCGRRSRRIKQNYCSGWGD